MSVPPQVSSPPLLARLPSAASAALLRAAPAIILLLATLILFWKIALTRQFTWADNTDLANQVLPWWQVQARQWHAGAFPLWDPHHWGGQPLLAQTQPGAAYPLNWLFSLLPLRRGYIALGYATGYFLLIHYLGALFAYLLCRDLRCSRTASIFGGILFGLAGYVGTTDWPQMINGAIWAPLVLLFLLRALQGVLPLRNACLGGACFGVSLLSGHHQVPTFVGLAVAGLFLWHLLTANRQLHSIALGAAFGAFTLLLGALQLFPAYEYWKEAYRWVGASAPVTWANTVPYNAHNQYGLHPVSLLGIVIPGIHIHANPYIGWVAVSLCVIAAAWSWHLLPVRLFLAIALGGLLYSLGGEVVFHGVLYALVPALDKARNASMAILIFHLGCAVLLAFGLDSLRSASQAQRRMLQPVSLVLAGCSFVLYATLAARFVFFPEKMLDTQRAAMAAFTALLLAALWLAISRGQLSFRSSSLLLGTLLLLDLGAVTGWHYPHKETGWKSLNRLSSHADLVAFLKSQPGPVRVQRDGEVIPYNFGDWHGIDEFDGYNGVTINVFRFNDEPQSRDLLGVNYFIGLEPKLPEHVPVFDSSSGAKVYRNPRAFPRTWSVHQVDRVTSDDTARTAMRQPLSLLRQRAFMESEPPLLEQCALPDRVRLANDEWTRAVLEAEMSCTGLVVLQATYLKGWEAYLDGRAIPVHQVYGFLRGVVVPRGRHRIEYRYRPRSVYIGAALTALGVCAALVLLFSRGAVNAWKLQSRRSDPSLRSNR